MFWRNVLPSMAAFAFSGLYTIVDGFFVGQNIGDLGIAAVNIAYPITALIQAIGSGVGMGGAIWFAISSGKGAEKDQNIYLGNTFLLLAALSVGVTGVLSAVYHPLLVFFGADGVILEYAADYLAIIVWGTLFQLCSVGLVPVIRNLGGSLVTMAAMIAGFVSNIAGDWLFTSVLSFGTAGAALATVLGQLIALIPCFVFLIRRRGLLRHAVMRPSIKHIRKIASTALAPLGSVISPMIVIIIMNKAALTYGGKTEAACYAVISYVTAMANLLMQGIGDGVQPLLSTVYGSGAKAALLALKKRAYALAFGTALLCGGLFWASIGAVPAIFGASPEVAFMYEQAFPYFLAGLLFTPVIKVTGCYLYATNKIKASYLLIYSEPVSTAILAGGILPMALHMQGVWLAVPVTQLLLAAVSIMFLVRDKRIANLPFTRYNHG